MHLNGSAAPWAKFNCDRCILCFVGKIEPTKRLAILKLRECTSKCTNQQKGNLLTSMCVYSSKSIQTYEFANLEKCKCANVFCFVICWDNAFRLLRFWRETWTRRVVVLDAACVFNVLDGAADGHNHFIYRTLSLVPFYANWTASACFSKFSIAFLGSFIVYSNKSQNNL